MRRIEKPDEMPWTAFLGIGIGTASSEQSDCTGQKDPCHFSLFVESADPRIGIFAASFAAHLLNNFLCSLPGEDDRELLAQVAGLIRDYPETQREIARLTSDLNESVENINVAIQGLAQEGAGSPFLGR